MKIKEEFGCLIFDGYKLIKDSLDCVPMDGKNVVLTVSPNSYGISVFDEEMNKALKCADYLQLDGLYFGWLPWFKYGKKAKRITGWDSFVYYAEKLEKTEGKMFFLGSTNETLDKIKKKMAIDYPHVKVDTYSPPYAPSFSDVENKIMHQVINAFAPDVLVVGMTAPKQEKWAFQNKDFLNMHVTICVGNVFDWYVGNSIRPNVFWQKIGMEWLVRIYYRPEIFKRNIGNQLCFFRHLLLDLLHIRKFTKNTKQYQYK